ncbi:MAG: hypothetical protein IKQ55_07710 [Kiritimatiellae bacterium]|nr:hypothetical protein [Kiritimatiellia bacterium]
MKPAPSPAFRTRRNERGVALIIVLGFLGLMVMMAVAFMVQARVERMVADSTLDGMRARQVAQTGIAAAIQDYMNAIKSLDSQSDTKYDMFLSGDLNVSASYHYSDILYDSTNLWNGEAADWLPASLTSSDSPVNIDDIKDMEWIWVRQKPNNRSRILGRYAYVCFNLSGGVDANLLGRAFGDNLPSSGYGAQTNRGNVRKMLLNGVRASPSTATDPQLKLARYQSMWQGFDTPAALTHLTDGKNNDGQNSGANRWAEYDMDEKSVGPLATDHLSCYSYAATHRGSGYGEKKPCTLENITGNHYFSRLVSEMGANEDDVRKALDDYFSSSGTPKGTDYPSVKAVPMFNEIQTQVQLVKDDGTGRWQLKVTVAPEFWCPFPSQDTPSQSYTLKPPGMAGGAAQSGSEPIWLRARVATVDGPVNTATFSQESVTPAEIVFNASDVQEKPKSPDKFEYILKIDGLEKEDGTIPDVRMIQLAGVIFQKPWELTLNGTAVDSTPKDALSFALEPRLLNPSAGISTASADMEVDDPRLNHLAGRWSAADGSMGDANSCLEAAKNAAKAKMGYEPGKYMYCRNGDMESPAELGFIPVYNGTTPWMTLDIFSENGIGLMNTLVCDDDAWKIMDKYDVFYTNGTINPYTRDEAVLNGAFYGLDAREVPNMSGNPSGNADVIGAERAKAISEELVKTEDPDGRAFIKDGPGGWTRVLRYKGFDLNKNERVMLAHNTWGLFNESDSLFLVFVVAQSITEAPEKVNPVGDWDEDDDMITGERWAVALCWMDTSPDGAADDLTQEMDIIMFKYLNE